MKEIAEIAVKAAKGDKEAFESLYRLTSPGVWFTCISLLKNEENAKDAMQNTYLAAFEKLNTLAEPDGVGSWLNKIAANKCKDYLKKSYVSKEQDGAEIMENISDEKLIPEEYVLDKEKRRILMDMIEKALTEEQRQTILLYYFTEMTASEIAGLMDCHEKTVQYRLKTARVKIKEEVLGYEKKNHDRLRAVALIPFLSRLLKAEAAEAAAPDGFYPLLSKALKGAYKDRAPKEAADGKKEGKIPGEKRSGKTLMHSVKAKVILGVLGTAAACGVIAGAVLSRKPADVRGHGENAAFTDSETDRAEADETSEVLSIETNEAVRNSRITSLIKINGVEMDLFDVTVGEMMRKAGVEMSYMMNISAPLFDDYEDGTIEAFYGLSFSDGSERRVPLDDTGVRYEIRYDTQMYVEAMADGKPVNWMDYEPVTPETCRDFRVKGIMVTDEITQNKSFVLFCGEICLGMSKKEIDAILGEGYDMRYCQTDRLENYSEDWSEEDYENAYTENAVESHYRSPEFTMIVHYAGIDGDAAAQSIRIYINESAAEGLPETGSAGEMGSVGETGSAGEMGSVGETGSGGETDTESEAQSGRTISLTEEIENAGFGSGLIQVNDAVFLQGVHTRFGLIRTRAV